MTIDYPDPPFDRARWQRQLESPDHAARLQAYQALAEADDAEAVALLQRWMGDDRPSGLHDERGCPLSHAQLAADALRRLLHRRPDLGAGVDRAALFGPGRLPHRAEAPPPQLAAVVPPPQRRRWTLPSAGGLAYGALGLGLLAPVWAFVLAFAMLSPQGLGIRGPGVRVAVLVLALPALAGAAAVLTALLRRRPTRVTQWLALGLGLLLCGRTLAWVLPELLR